MNTLTHIWPLRLAFIFSALLLSSCGSDGLDSPIGNLVGTWEAHEISDESGCYGGTAGTTYDYLAVILSQSENSVEVAITPDTTIIDYVGIFDGTIDGNRLTWSGSYSEDDGTTQSSVSLTVDSSCSTMTGTASWTWTNLNASYSCSGTSVIEVTRTSIGGC